MKRIFLATLTFIVVLTACSSDKESNNKTVSNKDFFTSYYQKNILPSVTKFKEEATLLKQTVTDFKASKSDANYQKITAQWLTTAKAYSKAEVYNFGLIKQRFYDANIYNFPINTSKIEENITQKNIYDINYFKSKSTVVKGLSTVEYLLYGSDYNTKKAKDALVENTQRLDYLLGVTDELLRQANGIINTWNNEYFQTFIKSDASICTENAKCIAVNQIINVLDIARVTKIGKPLGFEKSEETNVEVLEAFRSRSSLLLIEAMLEEVKYVYFTSDANISTLVNKINKTKEISNLIKSKYTTLEQQIATFNSNLYGAINANPQKVRPMYLTLKELTALFSVDVTSTLSIATLPTDNDGD